MQRRHALAPPSSPTTWPQPGGASCRRQRNAPLPRQRVRAVRQHTQRAALAQLRAGSPWLAEEMGRWPQRPPTGSGALLRMRRTFCLYALSTGRCARAPWLVLGACTPSVQFHAANCLVLLSAAAV